MRPVHVLALLLAALAGGCVVSKAPLDGLGGRATPVASGTTLQIFERGESPSAWKAGDQKAVTLVAGEDRIYRALDESGKPEEDGITFHALAPDRYLVQAQFSDRRYGFAVLQIRGGEGFVSPLDCKLVDPARLQKAGLKITADDCWLEDAADPVGFLKELAANPPAPTVKYVPVKPK